MPAKHRIKAKEVARDVRAGATDSDLMAKYDLSDEDLQVLFNKLVEGGAVERYEILERASKSERRALSREYLTFGLQIQDVHNPAVKAVVRNLSDTGFRLAGIKSEVGEEKDLLILADHFSGLEPILVRARCRWVKKRTKRFDYSVAGFEITEISEEGLEQLRELMRTIASHRR
jgi:hypothetical protein